MFKNTIKILLGTLITLLALAIFIPAHAQIAILQTIQGGTGAGGTLNGCLQGNGKSPFTSTGAPCGSGSSGSSTSVGSTGQIQYASSTPGAFAATSSVTISTSTGYLTAPIVDNGGQLYNAKAYGVVCDGSTDNATALNSLINAHPNAHYLLPRGTCNISSPVYVNSNGAIFDGSGIGATYINFTGTATTSGALVVESATPTSTQIQTVTISNLTVTRSADTSSQGSGIQLLNPLYATLQNVNVYGFFDNIETAGGDVITLDHVYAQGNSAATTTIASSSNLYIHTYPKGSGTFWEPYQITLTDSSFSDKASSTAPTLAFKNFGIYISAVDGFKMENDYDGEAKYNMYLQAEPTSGIYFADINVTGNFFDGNVDESTASVLIDQSSNSAGNTFSDMTFANNIMGVNNSYGMRIRPFGGNVIASITGNYFTAFEGVDLQAFTQLTVSGNNFTGCTYGVISEAAANFGSLTANGNTFQCSGAPINLLAAQATASTSVVITGNTYGNDTTPPSIDPSFTNVENIGNNSTKYSSINTITGALSIGTTTKSTALYVIGTTTTTGLNIPSITNSYAAFDGSGNLISTTTPTVGSGSNYFSASSSNIFPATTTSYITADHFIASSTTATSSFAGPVTVTSTTFVNGNVGIATSTPGYPLDVVGQNQAGFFGDNTSASSYIGFSGSGAAPTGRSWFGYDSLTSNAFVQAGAGKGIEFTVNSSTPIPGSSSAVITSGGYLGIGTKTPVSTLEVNGSTTIDTTLTVNSSYGASPVCFNVSNSSPATAFNVNCSTSAVTTQNNTLDSGSNIGNAYIAGMLGVGTTTGTKLSVIGTTTTSGLVVTGTGLVGTTTQSINQFAVQNSSNLTNIFALYQNAGPKVISVNDSGLLTMTNGISSGNAFTGDVGGSATNPVIIGPRWILASDGTIGHLTLYNNSGAAATGTAIQFGGITSTSPELINTSTSSLSVVSASTFATGGTSTIYFNIGTTTGSSAFNVNGTVQFMGSSTVITPSISGGIVTAGCDSATTSVDATVGSTTAFVTTPETYPGDDIWWESYYSSPNTITTKVCADVSVTPAASVYVVKIIK